MARKIELKELPLDPVRDGAGDIVETPPPFSFRDTIVTLLSSPKDPAQGIDYAEMKRRLELIAKVEAAGDHVILEESEWRELNEVLQCHRFGGVHKHFGTLGAAIENAARIDIARPDKEV